MLTAVFAAAGLRHHCNRPQSARSRLSAIAIPFGQDCGEADPIVAIQRRSFANGHRPLNFVSRTFAGAFKGIKPAFNYPTTNPIGKKLFHRL